MFLNMNFLSKKQNNEFICFNSVKTVDVLLKKLSLFFTEYSTNNFITTVNCETKPTSKLKNLNVFEGVIVFKLFTAVSTVQYTYNTN